MNVKRFGLSVAAIVIALLVIWPLPVRLLATSGFVATTSADTASATTVAVTASVTAGHGVIVSVQWNNNTMTGIAQTTGDTLTQATTLNSGGFTNTQYYNCNVAGGSTTYTFTWTNATQALIQASEISGQATSSCFDKGATQAHQAAVTVHDSGTTAALAQADEICVAQWNADGAGTTGGGSVNNSYTIPTNGNWLGSGKNMRGALAYLVTSGTGAQSVQLTTTDPFDGSGVIGCFKGATAGGARKCYGSLLGVGC